MNTHTQLGEVSQQLLDTRTLLTANQERIVTLESKVNTMGKEIKTLKEIVNHREQQGRTLNIRILGLPSSEEEAHGPDASAAAAKTAYDKIIRPLLASEKSKRIISTLPTLPNAVTQAYRMKSRFAPAKAGPIPLMITLSSPAIKLAIFRAKKDALPTPSDADKAAGSFRFTITEDLTSPTAEFLKQMRGDKRVARAWTVDGAIRYVRVGDKDEYVHRVRSVFDTLDAILEL